MMRRLLNAVAIAALTLAFPSVQSLEAAPEITQVVNNYSLIPAVLPNSGIAPGSLFIIEGFGLASPSALASDSAPVERSSWSAHYVEWRERKRDGERDDNRPGFLLRYRLTTGPRDALQYTHGRRDSHGEVQRPEQ